uniref:Uncharacterized protein n=1 Tax=Ciona intestinalis TaxID=7719 RepID=H2XXX3_CIOIN
QRNQIRLRITLQILPQWPRHWISDGIKLLCARI